jgi:GPI mannosyltransferase 4
MGIMTRITFIAFVLPIALQALLQSLTLAKDANRYSLTLWIQSIIVPFCIAIFTLGSVIVIDGVYFTGSARNLVFTPYNNLRYNLSQENLMEHGLHPRWLHVVVNLPLMVGPGLVIYGVLAAWRIWNRSREYKGGAPQSPLFIINRSKFCAFPAIERPSHYLIPACIWTIVCSLIILSIQPHQEPRFLAPLIVPFTVLVANSGYLQAAKKPFWV